MVLRRPRLSLPVGLTRRLSWPPVDGHYCERRHGPGAARPHSGSTTQATIPAAPRCGLSGGLNVSVSIKFVYAHLSRIGAYLS